jgi:hypothetical protein
MSRRVLRGSRSSAFLVCLASACVATALGLSPSGCANGDEDLPDEGADSSFADSAAAVSNDAGTAVPSADATVTPSADAALEEDSSSAPYDAGGADVAPTRPADAGSVTDASEPDTSEPDTSVAPDTGATVVDASDANVPLDAGTDAASGVDASSDDDSGPPDAAPAPDGSTLALSFTNPLQIDVSSILTIDSVGTTGDGGITTALTSMDGSGYDYYTAAVATAQSVSGGLPSNGLFAAKGTQNPVVQLHFNDPGTAPNSLLLNAKAPNNGTTFSFAVPASPYAQLQIYATSTEGVSALAITLTYSDSSTSSATFTIPDWGSNTATGSVFVLASGLGRVGTQVFEGKDTFFLYGANLNPSATKSLVGVAVTSTGPGRLVFYGATGW